VPRRRQVILFADVIIVFIVRALIQFFRSRKARDWPTVKAEVMTAQQTRGGCLTAEITYKYRINGELYTGTHTEPFLSASSLSCYLEKCSPGSVVTVRLKPGEPDSTIVRERDVYLEAHGYRIES